MIEKITCDDCKIATFTNLQIPKNWEKFQISQFTGNRYEIWSTKNLEITLCETCKLPVLQLLQRVENV